MLTAVQFTSQNMETISGSINRWMDKVTVVYIHNGIIQPLKGMRRGLLQRCRWTWSTSQRVKQVRERDKHCTLTCVCCAALSHFSCDWLCDPMNCSPPGSSVHGILQARRLDWVVIPSSWGSSCPRNQSKVSCTAGRFFTSWVPREAHINTQIHGI